MNDNTVASRDRSGEPFIDIETQDWIQRKLGDFRRRPDRSACHWAVDARYSRPPLRVAALRRSSREIVEATKTASDLALRKTLNAKRPPHVPQNERYRPDGGSAEDLNITGGMPPAFRNILFRQAATHQPPAQPPRWSSPAQSPTKIAGVRIAPLLAADSVTATAPVQAGVIIATSFIQVLRRPLESAQYAAQGYCEALVRHGRVDSMGRRRNPYDNPKTESFMKTLKVEAVYPMAYETFADVARTFHDSSRSTMAAVSTSLSAK
jgi:hypothetical protein